MAVEWNVDGNFELTNADADIVVRISGGHWMWQKERLLNLALAHLPSDCHEVAWLDCDVVFENLNWMRDAQVLLREYPLVQLYETAIFASEKHSRLEALTSIGGIGAGLYQRPGIVAASIECGRDYRALSASREYLPSGGANDFSPGFAWASTRDFLRNHPLFDTWIGGGGDSAYFWAAAGYPQHVICAHALGETRAEEYLKGSCALSDAVRGQMNYVKGRIVSLWHGDVENRQYKSRHQALRALNYQSTVDLCVDVSGVWSWTDPQSKLASWVMQYFLERREDG